MTFEEWIIHYFDHPITSQKWSRMIDADAWDGPDETFVAYLTRTFAQADTVLRPELREFALQYLA